MNILNYNYKFLIFVSALCILTINLPLIDEIKAVFLRSRFLNIDRYRLKNLYRSDGEHLK
jgi:hypothetical protein